MCVYQEGGTDCILCVCVCVYQEGGTDCILCVCVCVYQEGGTDCILCVCTRRGGLIASYVCVPGGGD